MTDGTWGLRKTEALKFILVIEIDILKEDSKTGGITVLPTLSGLENLKNDDAMDKKRIIIFKNNDYKNIMCQVLVILIINIWGSCCYSYSYSVDEELKRHRGRQQSQNVNGAIRLQSLSA